MLQGERKQAIQNKSLGRFDLADIPPSQRGLPQIEVTFDLDANGILNVSAKDKATGKEQSVVIKASSGLSDEEVEKMVKDAEEHATEDKKFEEMVQVRNQADGMIHATRKMLTDAADKVDAADKEAIEVAVTELEAAMKGDDKEAIDAKIQALTEASGSLVQKMQAEDATATEGAEANAANKSPDDAVDAEFEEVKETKDTKEDDKK